MAKPNLAYDAILDVPSGGRSTAELAFEGAALGMAVVELQGKAQGLIEDANEAMALLFGRSSSELTTLRLSDLADPDDADIDAALMRQLLAGRIPSYRVEKRFRRSTGEVFWAEMSVSLVRADNAGRPLHLIIQLGDVTDRKRAEDMLYESRERLAGVFDESPIGMAISALDGRWLQVNGALCRMLGYGEAELLSKRLRDLIHPDDLETVRRYIGQLFSGEVLGYHAEARATTAHGEVIWMQLSVSLVHDDDGAPAYVLVEVQDISERKRLEEELEQGALYDGLTGLPSRALVFDRLERACARRHRTGSPLAVMFANVDGLDEVRERFGRDSANGLMRQIGARILDAVRAGDTVGRYDGEEFVVICEDLESLDEASTIAQRIVETSRLTFGDDGLVTSVQLRLGMTAGTNGSDSAAGLIEEAGEAMQVATRQGLGYTQFSASE